MRLLLCCCLLCYATFALTQKTPNKSVYLEELSWVEAARVLTPDAVIVIPLGAAAKEHGPHLPLNTDKIQAEYFMHELAIRDRVVIAPLISYSYYPPFLKYPGSTSLRLTTSRDMLLEIVRNIASYGPRRFYVINEGITTTPVLAMAAALLKKDGILLYYSDYLRPSYDSISAGIRTRETGTHADEIETSHILWMKPNAVKMDLAVDDTLAKVRTGPSLSPTKQPNTTYSPSGIFGYAKLATKQKGKAHAAAILQQIMKDVDSVRGCALPLAEDNSAAYAGYIGSYSFPDGKKLIISVVNGQLNYILNGIDLHAVYPLFSYGNDRFCSQQLDMLFLKDDDGIIRKALCSNAAGTFMSVKESVMKK